MQEDSLGAVLNDIKNAKKTMADILEKDLGQSDDSQRLVYFLHALRVFQAEFSAHLKAWNEITQIVEVYHTHTTTVSHHRITCVFLSCRRQFNRALPQSVLTRLSPIYWFVQSHFYLFTPVL